MTLTETKLLDAAVAYSRAYANYGLLHDLLQKPNDNLDARVKASLVPVHALRDQIHKLADVLRAERETAAPPSLASEPDPQREPIHADQCGPV